jgi:hypothetical protein
VVAHLAAVHPRVQAVVLLAAAPQEAVRPQVQVAALLAVAPQEIVRPLVQAAALQVQAEKVRQAIHRAQPVVLVVDHLRLQALQVIPTALQVAQVGLVVVLQAQAAIRMGR